MMDDAYDIPVFKSTDLDAIARAVKALKDTGVPHQVVMRNEGSTKTPRSCHWIFVARQYEQAAQNIVRTIPSEMILPEISRSPTGGDNAYTWMIIGIIVIFIIVFIVNMI